jgi:hypothetical protein
MKKQPTEMEVLARVAKLIDTQPLAARNRIVEYVLEYVNAKYNDGAEQSARTQVVVKGS